MPRLCSIYAIYTKIVGSFSETQRESNTEHTQQTVIYLMLENANLETIGCRFMIENIGSLYKNHALYDQWFLSILLYIEWLDRVIQEDQILRDLQVTPETKDNPHRIRN